MKEYGIYDGPCLLDCHGRAVADAASLYDNSKNCFFYLFWMRKFSLQVYNTFVTTGETQRCT